MRMWRFGVLAATVALLMVVGSPVTAAGAQDPDIQFDADGEWSTVEDWPFIAIHALLTKDGKVLSYGSDAAGTVSGAWIYDIWTPGPSAGEGHVTMNNPEQQGSTDLFCNLQLNVAETGEVIMFGGDDWSTDGTQANADIVTFDPATNSLTQIPGMNRERWYATGTVLADGSFYVQGGSGDRNSFGGIDQPEVWTAERGAELLPMWTTEIDPWYPRNYLASNGQIFGFDITGKMYTISEDLSTLTRTGAIFMPPDARGSTAVIFGEDKMLVFGGSTTETWLVDYADPNNPILERSGEMSQDRSWVNGIVLPDGRVLAIGGSTKDAQQNPEDPLDSYGVAYAAEVWDPTTGQWTVMAAQEDERLYHSTALLLPDGRVLSAGGGAPGPFHNKTAEIFSPDYLLQADGSPTPRLEIQTVAPNRPLFAGDALSLQIDDGAAVDRVTLVKTGAVTHSVDMDQRFLELDYTTDGNRIDTALPSNPAAVPPGFYLVTVLDGNGVPSVSEIIAIESDLAPPAPPGPIAPRGAIEGQVGFADGTPAEGLKVNLFLGDENGNRTVFLRDTLTGPDGEYDFVADADRYVLTFTAPEGSTFTNGSQWLSTAVDVSSGETVSGVDTVIGQSVEQPSIAGTVTYVDGSPAAGSVVDLFTSDGAGNRGDWLGAAQTDVGGSYRFDVDAGQYLVTFIAPEGSTFTNGSQWLTTGVDVSSGEAVSGVDAVIGQSVEQPSIAGTVTYVDGSPAPGSVVDLFTSDGAGNRGDWLGAAQTDVGGSYRFDVDAGQYLVTFIGGPGETFVANGSRWLNVAVDVDVDEAVVGLDAELN